MTRKKVQLAWIDNDSARRTSLKKRRSGLLKKVSELTTLCDVDACLIVYSPDETQPMVWPYSDPAEVQRVVGEFFEKPSMERERKTVNQGTYLLDSDTKMQEQLRKSQRRCKEAQMNYLMHQLNQGHRRLGELSVTEMDGVVWFLDEKMKRIRRRLEISQPFPSQDQPAAAAGGPLGDLPLIPPPLQGPTDDGAFSSWLGGDRSTETFPDSLLHDQWFI